ncbi:hypothetical protein MJO28_003514 [Puccinia striiformis f. sp. tritici]|uniref:HIG1 domain-containing protein n=2 Tax=Puccinia striiformis f. sp. tritici TaxID=168172 RepID=A0A0L0VAC2_9BASI|nr:hypothetical protein Pst134EA_004587 [Puccinia striiformis f. sp. tritici]KAI9613314.1 hypothetical protein H4Q26_009914 [Puccinia striiformis f. sp. tritici PST-130]KNE96156.1 hypothetical protein PSTG_10574 [Puccinia striiformis f. sp. tritici PST-78]KAH9470660.1 hypothetical protein Pst134EA_004587 [Puccinia striiformis f. sp. tritici]KAI7959723.1 hypothetical protein MJO28_003514 [Puccinia striiformis f. sp. tritici]KAI7965468.1 hypothetical protein MJO29_003566 [Puccinia striiformis f.
MFNLPSSSNPGQTQGNGSSNQPIIHFEDLNDEDEETIPSTWELFSRKFKEQPLVPIGAGATTIALLGAGRAIQRGESNSFNLWCRYRVVFQALTLVAALGGSLYYNKERQETQRIKEEEREKMRIYQRDLRMRSQEQAASKPHQSSLITPVLDQVSDSQNSLFNNQNSQIRKALLDRKISDQHKHLDSSSSPNPSDKN